MYPLQVRAVHQMKEGQVCHPTSAVRVVPVEEEGEDVAEEEGQGAVLGELEGGHVALGAALAWSALVVEGVGVWRECWRG